MQYYSDRKLGQEKIRDYQHENNNTSLASDFPDATAMRQPCVWTGCRSTRQQEGAQPGGLSASYAERDRRHEGRSEGPARQTGATDSHRCCSDVYDAGDRQGHRENNAAIKKGK